MPLRVPNQGETTALNILVNKTASENLRLRLYSNDVTPGEADVLATYTEVAGFGYSNLLLTPASWVTTSGDPSFVSYPEVVFTFTGAFGTVYGYYITGETSGVVRWAERFATPFVVTDSGDKVKVTAILTLKDTVDA